MTPTRHRNAWIWVALAALTIASVAQAERGTQSARAYARPVLQFLAGGHTAQAASSRGIPRLAQDRSTRQFRVDRRQALTGAWLAMLPVFFIGLITPLNQFSCGLIPSLGGVPASPLLPHSFQRPPPFQFA